MKDGDIPPEQFLEPEPAALEDVRLAHTEAYTEDLAGLRYSSRMMTSELPLSGDIVRAYLLGTGGTILACRRALQDGLSVNLTGGFHHAFPDHAEGFCYINDVAVAIRRLKADGLIERAAVVDCDVHQGNGTAFIFQAEPSVFTFSMHQENNYPIKQRSDLDIGLPDGTGDEEYIAQLARHLPRVLDRSRPELVVYLAGVDPYRDDLLGGLGLTLEGLERRDELVVNECLQRAIPLAAVLAGGYAADTAQTVAAHRATCRVMWDAGQMKG